MKKSLTTALVLTVIMAFMELTGVPAALLPDINIADINPIYFTLMTNFLFASCRSHSSSNGNAHYRTLAVE